MKRLGALVASALVVGGLVAAPPAHAEDDETPRKLAACDYRICVYVLDAISDSDGDGVADVDERYFKNGVLNAHSTPTGPQLIDAALKRELPSFESHLTELVVLPQVSADRGSLATGLGSISLPTTPWNDDLSSSLATLAKNGFSDILTGIGVARSDGGAGVELPGSIGTHFTYMQLVSNSTDTRTFSFSDFRAGGVNEGRTGGSSRTSEVTPRVGGITTSIGGAQVTTYADGSEDKTTFSGSTNTQDGETEETTTGFTTTSTNATTGTSSVTTSTTKTKTDKGTGNSTSSTTSNTVYKDKDGNTVGSSKTTSKSETKDGTKTTTSTTTTTSKDGTTTPPTTETKKEKCPDNKCPSGRTDPDYVGVGPLTEADHARVIARLNSVRTPGPDTGIVLGDPPKVKKRDLYALYSGDGVVVLSAQPNPRFNSAQPEYHPGLRDLSPMAGVLPPNTDGYGTGYWPDWP